MKRLFTRCMMLLALLVMGVVTAFAQKSVLNESFESGTLPSGWTTAGSYWQFSANKAQFNGAFENAADTLVTPVVSLNELTNVPTVTLAYSLPANGSYVNTLQVLYRETEQSAWAELKTINEAAEDAVLSQALPAGLSSVQIGIAVAYKLGGITYLSNVRIANKADATAAPTGLRYEDLTTTSVTLWWEASQSPEFEQYNVKVSTTKLDDPSNAEGDVLDRVGWNLTDEFYELANLTPNTDYWLYVQYDCGYGDLSPWAELNFKTPCEAISAPFYEDFEDELSGCYAIAKDGTAAVSSEYPYNSTRSFKFVGTKGNFNYLFLPELNGDAKNYQVSFMAAAQESGNTYARTITIGVANEQNAASFTEVATFNLPKGRTWENIIVSLKGYAGTGKYIAFRAGNADKENRLFIDDIRIEAASSCPKPMFVQVTEITPNSAKLAWTKTGNETEWNLVLSTKPLNDPEDIEPDDAKGEFAGSVSTNPYTLSNLLPNTTYYAYLQAGCGSSEWTSAVEFTTGKEVSYPYYEAFDRMDPDLYTNDKNAVPSGWVMDNRGINPSFYYDYYYNDSHLPYVSTAYDHTSSAYVAASLLLRGTRKGDGISYYSSIAMLPAMPKDVTGVKISFWAYTANSGEEVVIGVANTQTADLAQGEQLGVNIKEVSSVALTPGAWTKYTVNFKSYTGSGRYITFYLKPGDISTPAVYVDDIEIDDYQECDAVTGLTATANGTTKANISWTDATSATNWKVKISKTSIDPATADGDAVNTTVNTKSYAATGLAMGTTYNVYVSPACGDVWESTTVTTSVGLEVPYYNDFTNETTGKSATRGPKNWKLGYTYTDSPAATSSYWPYVETTAWTNAPADVAKPSLYLYNTASTTYQFPYAIMPELLNADIKDLKISFYIYTTLTTNLGTTADPYYDELQIGVVNSPNYVNKTNKFDSITNVATVHAKASKTPQRVVIDMSSYPGSGKYIVFYQNLSKANHSYIDNLSITLATAPQKVSDIDTLNVTQTSAQLTWTENGNATKWEIRVFDAAQEDPEVGTPVFSDANVTVKPTTITGLTHSTQYYAYVRSVQDNGTGDWANVSFWTETGVWSLPFAEDFDSYYATSSYRTLPEYYLILQADGTRLASMTYHYVYDLNGETFIKHQATSTAAYKVTTFALPPFDKPITNLQMTFDAHADAITSSTDALKQSAIKQSPTEIGILEEDGTFVPIDTFSVSTIEWEPKYVNFTNYTGAGGRIAIRCDYNKSNANNVIRYDNIEVSEMPACGRLLGVSVNDIDSTTATLSWSAVKTETAWNLKVSSTQLDEPDEVIADVFDGQLTEKTKMLSELEGNTYYYIYIQPVDPANNCTGDWSSATVFRTLCKKQKFPYYEDFDSYSMTGAGYIPDCSYLSSSDGDLNHSYINTRGATGNKALYLRQVTKDHNNYFAFPALDVDSVKRLQLSMKVNPGSTTTTNYYYYEVGVMTDPNDPSTFTSVKLDSVQGAAATVFYDRMYTFEGYTGDEHGNFGTYIALKPLEYKNPVTYQSDNTKYSAGYVYIDDVEIDFIETCFKPTDLTAAEVGIDTVKLSWQSENDVAATQRVRLYTDADSDPAIDEPTVEVTVNAKEAVVRSLKGNTQYYAYVRTECGEGDYSKWSSVYTFRTNCPDALSLPYTETFEDGVAGNTPFCWTSLLMSGSSAKAQVVATSTYNYAFESAQAMSVNKYYSQSGSSSYTTGQAAVVTPALDVESLKDVLMYCDIRSSSTTHNQISLKIEAVSDNTTNADAVYITTIEDLTSTWTKAYLKLGDYYTSAQPYKYLRFTPQITISNQSATVYIDNITFTTDLNAVLPVAELRPEKVSESTAEFSFKEMTPGIEAWEYAYVVAGGDLADATIVDIDTTYVTLSGLASKESVDIYVRSDAEGSEWVGPITMTTCSAPTSIPYATGFEDTSDNAAWEFQNVNAAGKAYPNIFIFGDAAKCDATGTTALYVSDNNADYEYQGVNSYSYVSRNIRIENAGSYVFSIKAKVEGRLDPESNYDCIYAHLVPAGSTFLASNITLLDGTTRSYSASADSKNCYGLTGNVTHVSEWTTFTKKVDVTEPGVYAIVIVWTNFKSQKMGKPAAIDSVAVEEYFCTDVQTIKATSLTATTASFEWFAGNCKNFEYVVSRFANLGQPNLIDDADKVATGMLSAGPALSVEGLEPNTNYSLYLRTVCQDGYTDWVEYDFQTTCGLESVPYIEAFAETPECWILRGASVTTVKHRTVAMKTANQEADTWPCLLLANNSLAILPELDIPLNKIQVEIGAFNGYSYIGGFSLGTITNVADASSFQEIAYYSPKEKASSDGSDYAYYEEDFVKMLNLYQGSGKYLALRNTSGNMLYIKYIKLTELPDCVAPQQVEITSITENAATINWIAGIEELWEIKVDDEEPFVVTENPYRLTELEQGTTYSVSVRALCDENSKSEWSQSTTFQTTCGVNPLPMTEDFSSLVKNKTAELRCWDNMVSEQTIERIFDGTGTMIPTPSTKSYSYKWTANWWNSTLGGTDQLCSQDQYEYSSSYSSYKYRWFISPQYAIVGNASLSFDARYCTGKGEKTTPNGRFFVAISTDNGVTWKKEDAINLTAKLDSVYSTLTVSLDQYTGQNIRVAFYHEGLNTSWTYKFLLIDNVRMNCTQTFDYTDNACEGVDYEGYGFSIKVADQPLAGEDSTYTRFAQNKENGCDSVINLTLTTRTASAPVTVNEAICQGESYDFGGQALTQPNPAGQPYLLSGTNQYGCDSTVYLYLTVNPSDTADIAPVEVYAYQLPYQVDENYTIPADAQIGNPFTEVVKIDGCNFNRYFITVLDNPTGIINLTADVDYIDVYDALGRKILTLRHGDAQNVLPVGVYMLRTTMTDGQVVNSKLFIK